MNKETKALQNLEQILQSKKDTLESFPQEWAVVIDALKAVEAARIDDLNDKINKLKQEEELERVRKNIQKIAADTKIALQEVNYNKMAEYFNEKSETLIGREKEAQKMMEQLKKERLTKNGDPVAKFKAIYEKMAIK